MLRTLEKKWNKKLKPPLHHYSKSRAYSPFNNVSTFEPHLKNSNVELKETQNQIPWLPNVKCLKKIGLFHLEKKQQTDGMTRLSNGE